jgi:beta-lactamase regulating signal transducer with metallopeptidase domain
MPILIPTFNDWAEAWLKVMEPVLWQSTLLVVLAALIAWCLRRSSPVVRYWLWQIVALKLLLMPFWTLAVPLPSWVEGKRPTSTAASQPVETLAESARPMPRRVFPLTASPDAGAASAASSLGRTSMAVSWRAWLLLIWLAVVLGQTARLLAQRTRLARLLRLAVPVEEDLAGLVAELAGQVGLRRPPTTVSIAGECPLFVCGLWRPRLVVPSRLLASLNRAERRQVILHELAHLKRRDLLWGWPVEIARIAYFFHPLVYWVAYQLRLERELACDQLAMVRSGHPPADYARTLVQVVAHISEPAAVHIAAISAGLTGSQPPPKEQ